MKLNIEGRISRESSGTGLPIKVGGKDLELELIKTFGRWQMRAKDDEMPGTYRVTVERLDEKEEVV